LDFGRLDLSKHRINPGSSIRLRQASASGHELAQISLVVDRDFAGRRTRNEDAGG
jgi:hypothetical protein